MYLMKKELHYEVPFLRRFCLKRIENYSEKIHCYFINKSKLDTGLYFRTYFYNVIIDFNHEIVLFVVDCFNFRNILIEYFN